VALKTRTLAEGLGQPIKLRPRAGHANPRSDSHAAPEKGVVNDEKNNGPNDRDQQAVEIEPCHAGHTEAIEQPTAYYRADDAEKNVYDETVALLVDQFARDKARDQTQDDPGKY
jgi:hypothetical protein